MKDGESGIIFVDAEDDFVIWIILTAEAGVVFVVIPVQALDRFEATDRGRKSGYGIDGAGSKGEPNGAVDDEQVIDERDAGGGKDEVLGDKRSGYHTGNFGMITAMKNCD